MIFNFCEGEGKCLIQCKCVCTSKCECVHKNHNGYCPNNCCELIPCRNNDLCNNKMPLWILYEHNGLCDTCFVQMGKHEYINESVEECPICLTESTMIKLECNHLLCNECWYNITLHSENDENKDFVPECPMCRNKN